MGYLSISLCACVVSIAAVVAIAIVIKQERAKAGPVCKHDLCNSSWRSVHPGFLLGLRCIAFLYMLGILIYDIFKWGPFVYEYFTVWCFTLDIIYFGVAMLTSARSLVNEESDDKSITDLFLEEGIEGEKKCLQSYSYIEANISGYIMQVIFQVALAAGLLVDFVYWTCIFPSMSNVYQSHDLVAVSMHAVNLVLLLADSMLGRMTFPLFRAGYFVIWSGCYIIFTWIIHLCGENVWAYPFLDVDLTWAPLWYFLLCIGHLFAYGLVYLILSSKEKIQRFLEGNST